MFQMKDNKRGEGKKIDDATAVELDQLKDNPDSEILFMDDPNGGDKVLLRGADLPKLVLRATSHEFFDQEFITTLLMTHHSFTTSVELLDQLAKRYQITPQYGLTERMFRVWIEMKIVPIRMNVCNVLKYWLDYYFEGDFSLNESLVLYFRDFVETKIMPDFSEMGKILINLLQEKINAPPLGKIVIMESSNPSSKSDFLVIATDASIRHHLELDAFSFYEYVDSAEMAKHMTIIDYNYFSRVKPHELLDQIWGERRLKELTPGKTLAGDEMTGITRMIHHTNHVSYFHLTIVDHVGSNENSKLPKLEIPCKRTQVFRTSRTLLSRIQKLQRSHWNSSWTSSSTCIQTL
jgi:hypothetical protein